MDTEGSTKVRSRHQSRWWQKVRDWRKLHAGHNRCHDLFCSYCLGNFMHRHEKHDEPKHISHRGSSKQRAQKVTHKKAVATLRAEYAYMWRCLDEWTRMEDVFQEYWFHSMEKLAEYTKIYKGYKHQEDGWAVYQEYLEENRPNDTKLLMDVISKKHRYHMLAIMAKEDMDNWAKTADDYEFVMRD